MYVLCDYKSVTLVRSLTFHTDVQVIPEFAVLCGAAAGRFLLNGAVIHTFVQQTTVCAHPARTEL